MESFPLPPYRSRRTPCSALPRPARRTGRGTSCGTLRPGHSLSSRRRARRRASRHRPPRRDPLRSRAEWPPVPRRGRRAWGSAWRWKRAFYNYQSDILFCFAYDLFAEGAQLAKRDGCLLLIGRLTVPVEVALELDDALAGNRVRNDHRRLFEDALRLVE